MLLLVAACFLTGVFNFLCQYKSRFRVMERFLKGYRPSPAKQPRLAESLAVKSRMYESNIRVRKFNPLKALWKDKFTWLAESDSGM